MKITLLGRAISKKNNRRNFNHTSLPSVAFEKFHHSAMAQLLYKGYKKFTKPVFIDYVFYMKGKMDSDTDNMEGGINDILQDAGILENDKLIIEHHCKKIAGNKEFVTELSIVPFSQVGVDNDYVISKVTKREEANRPSIINEPKQ